MNVRRTEILLDSNLWRYVVDADAVEDLRKTARASDTDIVACPAVAIELLRTPDKQLRRLLLKAITEQRWLRPMPEAYEETIALRDAIRRHRPEWLNGAPDLRAWYRLRADWKGKWWQRMRQHTEREAFWQNSSGGDDLNLTRQQAKRTRTSFLEAEITLESVNLRDPFARFNEPRAGWDGSSFEVWRADSMAAWWRGLIQEGPTHTYREWLGPWLNLRALRRSSETWVRFWTSEVTTRELPLDWIRWALRIVQATRKTTNGTPVDNQIGTYLPGCDIIATADKGFGECVARIAPYSPVVLAEPLVTPAGAEGVDVLLEFVRATDSRTARPR